MLFNDDVSIVVALGCRMRCISILINVEWEQMKGAGCWSNFKL